MPPAVPLPFIGPQHFRAFKDMLGGRWSRSYQDWLLRHAIEKAEREKGGSRVQEIQIEPEELRRYAQSYDRSPSAEMLSILAIEKAMSLFDSQLTMGTPRYRPAQVEPRVH